MPFGLEGLPEVSLFERIIVVHGPSDDLPVVVEANGAAVRAAREAAQRRPGLAVPQPIRAENLAGIVNDVAREIAPEVAHAATGGPQETVLDGFRLGDGPPFRFFDCRCRGPRRADDLAAVVDAVAGAVGLVLYRAEVRNPLTLSQTKAWPSGPSPATTWAGEALLMASQRSPVSVKPEVVDLSAAMSVML